MVNILSGLTNWAGVGQSNTQGAVNFNLGALGLIQVNGQSATNSANIGQVNL